MTQSCAQMMYAADRCFCVQLQARRLRCLQHPHAGRRGTVQQPLTTVARPCIASRAQARAAHAPAEAFATGPRWVWHVSGLFCLPYYHLATSLSFFSGCLPFSDIVIVGTGKSYQLIPAEVSKFLSDNGISLEVMDTVGVAPGPLSDAETNAFVMSREHPHFLPSVKREPT